MNIRMISLLMILISAYGATAAADEIHLACPNGRSQPEGLAAKPTLVTLKGQKLKKNGRLTAFNRNFRRPVRCVVGDFNGDETPDFLFGTGPGTANLITIVDGATKKKVDGTFSSFTAYDPAFKGGIYVAAGDINNDGTLDIIAGAGSGSSEVKVVDGTSGTSLNSFSAYDPSFIGGVRVASGDVTGDGVPEIITGPANDETPPEIRVFDGQTSSLVSSFLAYDSSFRGGVYVAAGDITGDGLAEIITGAGAGGGPHVKVFDGATNSTIHDFFPYAASFKGGVTVATGDVNGDGQLDIITGPGRGGNSKVIAINGNSFTEIGSLSAFPKTFKGGVFVGSQAPAPAATPSPTPTPTTPASFLDVLATLSLTSFSLTQEQDGCGLGSQLSANFNATTINFSNIPGNSSVVFSKQTQTNYTASGVIIFAQDNHLGTLTTDGCDVNFLFVNQTSQAQCQSRYHFNPVGTPAETILDTDAFATCP